MKLSALCLFIAINLLPNIAHTQTDKNAFGDSIFTSNGLTGKIYKLPDTTTMLPDFDTMHDVSTIYTKTIDVPARAWSTGFPGLRDRFEWFGIEYKGSFKAEKEGHYTFRLVSDDGSKLFIDDKLIIDNDGLHGDVSKSGEVDLDNSVHTIKIQYFQGPRYVIALQLFAALPEGKEEPFPSGNFTLYTNPPKSFAWIYWLISGIATMITVIIVRRRKKKEENTA